MIHPPKTEIIPITSVTRHPRNARTHNLPLIRDSLRVNGQYRGIVVNQRDNTILAGNGTHEAAQLEGWEEIAVTYVDVDPDEALRILLVDNRANDQAGYDEAALIALLDGLPSFDGTGYDADALAELQAMIDGTADSDGLPGEGGAGSLADRFGVPPFSVLDARQGYWQERKRAWLALGLRSEEGRDARSFNKGAERRDETSLNIRAIGNAQSIFDPVLCELAYRWFAPDGGSILDPFAGGSVRGIVAAWLGYPYLGIDLRPEQVDENETQAEVILADRDGPEPKWLIGDSANVLPQLGGERYDLLFTCPPYYDLEQYSDNPADLSNAGSIDDFAKAYEAILTAGVERLNPNRFAVIVIGEARNKAGFYYGLIPATIRAMEQAGARYYGEAALVTPVGTLAARVANQFQASRKIGKAHQNVLIFYKGDPKTIRDTYGEVEIADLPDDPEGD